MVVFNELFMGVPQRVSNIDTPHKHTKLLNNERRRLILFFFFFKRTFVLVLASFSVRFMVVYVILNEIFITHFFVSLFIYLILFSIRFLTCSHTSKKWKKKMRNLHISNCVFSWFFCVWILCQFYFCVLKYQSGGEK